MTTQELKEYINSKLGNSLRTLLPSYWWKRLFGLVVDRVEEVEGGIQKVEEKIIEIITSSLAEFAEKYPDIESRTFYVEDSTEKIEKNAELLRKVLEEYQNGIVQQVYLATLFNGETGKLIVTSPQFIVTSGFRFINVALPLFKVLKDVIINEDGTFALEDAKYIDYVDTSKFATTAQLQELDNILSEEIDGLKDSKQNTLVSGTNIKTINGESILGNGNITVSGNSSESVTKADLVYAISKSASQGRLTDPGYYYFNSPTTIDFGSVNQYPRGIYSIVIDGFSTEPLFALYPLNFIWTNGEPDFASFAGTTKVLEISLFVLDDNNSYKKVLATWALFNF